MTGCLKNLHIYGYTFWAVLGYILKERAADNRQVVFLGLNNLYAAFCRPYENGFWIDCEGSAETAVFLKIQKSVTNSVLLVQNS